MAWTDETKQQAVDAYLKAEPTPETSTEIIKQIAADMDQTSNGVRMILIAAGVYIKKDPAKPAEKTGTSGTKSTGDGTKRVSKESQINALKAAIEASGAEVDDEILDKLTGKAAVYFLSIMKGK